MSSTKIDYTQLSVSQLKGKRDMLQDSKRKLSMEQQELSRCINEINSLIEIKNNERNSCTSEAVT